MLGKVGILGERRMGIYQGMSEHKPEAPAIACRAYAFDGVPGLTHSRLHFGLVVVSPHLPLALFLDGHKHGTAGIGRFHHEVDGYVSHDHNLLFGYLRCIVGALEHDMSLGSAGG